MSYPLSITLSLALLLSACTTVTEKPTVATVQNHKIIAPTSSTNITTETILEMPMQKSHELQGSYSLEKGQISFSGIRKTINSSDLVIEKLNESDFGYYYTVQVEQHPTNKYFGIFHYKEGKYVQKVISDGEVSYYDNIELIQEGDRLKLTLKTSQGKRIIIWQRNHEVTPTPDLLKAKKSYIDVYRVKYNKLGLNSNLNSVGISTHKRLVGILVYNFISRYPRHHLS